MSLATELEGGGEDGVEVPAAGGEGEADHGRGHEAVDCGGVLGFPLGDDAGAKAADERGDGLDDCAVEDGDGEVGGADVVDGGVGAADVRLGDFQLPQHLDHPEQTDHTHRLWGREEDPDLDPYNYRRQTRCGLLVTRIRLF